MLIFKEKPGNGPVQHSTLSESMQNVCFHIRLRTTVMGGDHFRVDGSDVTIAVYRACEQEEADTPRTRASRQKAQSMEHALTLCGVLDGSISGFSFKNQHFVP